VNATGSFTASGCYFGVNTVTFAAGSAVSLTGNVLGFGDVQRGERGQCDRQRVWAGVYCPVDYVPKLLANPSFNVVYLSGGH